MHQTANQSCTDSIYIAPRGGLSARSPALNPRLPVLNLSLWQCPAQPAAIRELSSLQASDLPDIRCPTSLDSLAAGMGRLVWFRPLGGVLLVLLALWLLNASFVLKPTVGL